MDMEKWARVRRKVLMESRSKRSVMAEEGIHWETLQKMLSHSQPPGYRQVKKRGCSIDEHAEWVQSILEADRELPKKQRHTAKRIHQRLKIERKFKGGYTVVKELVAQLRALKAEVFVPLIHRPGEAQVDFGHALVNLGGILKKCPFFVMSLPYSDAFYVQVFERECTESFWEGHVRAFQFFGAVPRRISYDNSKVAVAQMLGGRERKLTDGFLALQSHYLFAEHFCRAARGNEKGVVEGIVRYSRSNFLVPVPQVRALDELNARLEESCREDRKRRLRGKHATKEVLLAEELIAMRALPEVPFAACRVVATGVSSLSLVRFDCNDYSVPVRCAHRDVVVKGDCESVRIYGGTELVAEHRRIWEREQVRFEPLHYLALLERKPGALDFARPLEGWNLPECFAVLRRRLEAEAGGKGTKEYIAVLRLLERHSLKRVEQAVSAALDLGCPRKELISQHLYGEQWQAGVFCLDGREHLKLVQVRCTNPLDYRSLLGSEAEEEEIGLRNEEVA
jgi:transposase